MPGPGYFDPGGTWIKDDNWGMGPGFGPSFPPRFPPSFPPSFPPRFAPNPIDAPRPPALPTPQAPPASPPPPIKIPTRDIFALAESEISAASQANILFQEIGAIEIVNLTRRDTVEGQKPNYNIINNLPSVRSEFNPSSILSNQFFEVTETIDINKITEGIPLSLSPSDILSVAPNGDIIVNTLNVQDDEFIEVQIATQQGFQTIQIES
jgi:hypothetical protein